jgi:isocitrate dehydrogenase
LVNQEQDSELKAKFAPLAKALADNEQSIVAELNNVQGQNVDIGGYYKPDQAKLDAVMRPSATLNQALTAI